VRREPGSISQDSSKWTLGAEREAIKCGKTGRREVPGEGGKVSGVHSEHVKKTALPSSLLFRGYAVEGNYECESVLTRLRKPYSTE